MNPINQLNRSQDIEDGDLFPFFDISAGANRVVTAKTLATYVTAELPLPSGVSESYYLDAQNRGISIPINTVPTGFLWPTVVSEFGTQSFNPANSVFVMPFTGMYTFVFMYNAKSSAGSHQIVSAAETSVDGVTWTPSQYSARWEAQRAGDSDQALFASTNRFTAGTRLKFVTWCDSNISITSETPTGGAGFTIPASRILVTGIRTE